MTQELLALTDELRATNAMLATVADRLDAADRRANRHRLYTGVLALCVLANAVLFGLFWKDDRADDTSACLRANAGRADIREAILETVRTVATTDDQARLDAVLVKIDVSLRKTLPDRNC